MTFKMCINKLKEFGGFLIENFIEEFQSHSIFEEILKELVTCPLEKRNLRECEVLLMMGLLQKTEYGQIKTWERIGEKKAELYIIIIYKSLKDCQKFALV